jgi:maltose alpha-D-glucosyltransferase/alpha-amylase
VRHDETDTIVVLANLSNQVQPAELDLTAYEGLMPQEMFGGAEFPAIGTAPYFLALGPYASYWFILRAPEPVLVWTEVTPGALEALEATLPVLVLSGRWESLFAPGVRDRLEADLLPAYLARQRWFSAKARTIERSRLVDYGVLQAAAPPIYLLLVEVTYAQGGTDTYALLLGISTDEVAKALLQSDPGCVLTRVRSRQGEGLLHDAMGTEAAAWLLLNMIQGSQHLISAAGELRAFVTPAYPELRGPAEEPLPIRQIQGEQSNSLMIYGSRLIFKFLRRVEAGVHPEIELGRYLMEHVSLPFVPPLAGGLTYRRPGAAPMTIGLLHGYIRSAGTGWDYTLDLLGRYYEQVLAYTEVPMALDMRLQHLLALAAGALPEEVRTAVATYLVPAENLGQRTAALHLALAQSTSDAAFAPEPMTAAHLAALATTLGENATQVLEELLSQADRLPEPLSIQAHQLVAQRAAIMERLHAVAMLSPGMTRIRCHGDYHLGQLLWHENNFVILDFEGEPLRPLAERRRKQTPLKDVASMLWSLSYAAYTALFAFIRTRPEDLARLEPWAAFWQQWISVRFLQSYLTATAGASFLPSDRRDLATLLDAFVLDKALYELHYELNHRLEWVRIPLQSVLRLLEIYRTP